MMYSPGMPILFPRRKISMQVKYSDAKYACGKKKKKRSLAVAQMFSNLGATDILLVRLTNLSGNNRVMGSNSPKRYKLTV